MAATVIQESVSEAPRLALSVPASTSPFPSPGSPFLPPPKLSPHEFANRLSPVDLAMRNQTKRKSREEDSNGVLPLDGESTPTIAVPSSPPITPTPQTFLVQQQPAQVTIPDPPLDSLSALDKSLQRSSLSSSRPAPPSPALSRRTSTALSRHSTSSSVRSRPQSRVTESGHAAEPSTSTVVPPIRRSLLLKVRDFGFPQADDRHFGKGPLVPRENRVRHRGSLSSASSSSADDSTEMDPEDSEQHDSWTFRWNTLSSHFWSGQNAETDHAAPGPSRMDFGRNFEASSPPEEASEPDYDEYEDAYEEQYAPPSDELLVPGTYRALYAFEPEGTAEMALEEEQIVHVVGRGGGVGWAIVEKEGGGHALVPESYLELVKADEVDEQT